MRYAQPQLKFIDFSPGERFLVTCSSQEPSNPRDTHRVVLNIFYVRTGKVMRDFRGSADDYGIGGPGGLTGFSWPVFRLRLVESIEVLETSRTSVILKCHQARFGKKARKKPIYQLGVG